MTTLEIRAPGSEAELQELDGLLRQSFNAPEAAQVAYRARVGPENFRVAVRDGRLVAGLAIYWMGHWFGGRSVPVCGIAAVGVRVGERGKGVGAQLVWAVLDEARTRGVPLASLYASTQGPYRRVGFEQAGFRNRAQVTLAHLRPGERPLPVHDLDLGDLAAVEGLYTRWARGQSGLLDRNRAIWQRVVRGDAMHGVLLGDPADPEGYAIWNQSGNGTPFYDLELRDRAWRTPRAARQLWTVIADHRSMATHLKLSVGASDPWLGLLPEARSVSTTWTEPWMLRVIDLGAAIAARGFAPGVSGELSLELADADFEDHAGRWTVAVADGRGQATRGGTGALKLDRRALAPLFSGLWTAEQLASLGQVEGDAAVLAEATRLFAGPTPWMVDHF